MSKQVFSTDFTRLQRRILAGLMFLQVFLLAALLHWNYIDPRLEALSVWSLVRGNSLQLSNLELLSLYGIVVIAIVSGAMILLSPFWVRRRLRSVRLIYLSTALIAMWFGLAVNWSSFAWLGHRARAAEVVKEVNDLAISLYYRWPEGDGEHSVLGPFMAYPNWSPRTLILLTPMPLTDGLHSLTAVDRDGDVLRFELSDGFTSMWLEWWVSDKAVQKQFTSGIGETHRFVNATAVDNHWRVARYQ